MAGREGTRWRVAPRDPQADAEAARQLDLHPLVAAVLRNRGVEEPAAVRRFLQPSAEDLHDPSTLPDLAPVVARLSQAADRRERVLVHGDYDADGLTGAALLTRVLERLGCEVHYHIPHRVHEQYGVSEPAVVSAAQAGVTLLVTVDCGVADHGPLARARALGLEVVVIDHHPPGPTLPEGVWVVDPQRVDSAYPERELAGVGLAFKVASALCQARGVSEASLQRSFLDLVAVGTIADVVPLRGENRVLTALGLRVLAQTRSPGLRALLDLVGLVGPIRGSDVAFRVAPRLNAAGRIGDAADALELLLAEDPEQARVLAKHLDDANRARQQEQETVYQQARGAVVEQVDLAVDRVIVVAGPQWHVGVVGIVASKLLEEFNRPTIVLTDQQGELRGSARSVAGFDIGAALAECAPALLRFGGHALAAGLTLRPEDLEEFRERLRLVAAEALPEEALGPEVSVDAETRLAEISPALVEQLARLEPYGEGNPEPLFLSREVEVVECRPVGAEGRHLKLYVAQEGRTWEAIGFGLGAETEWIRPGAQLDLCYTPELSTYQGVQRLQLRLEALRPHQSGEQPA